MSKKDILAQGELMPTEVGPWIYVWSPGGRKPTGGRECVISAHGVESRINSGIPKPKVTLYFYCPHGWNLNDPGLVGVNSGRAR